MASNVLLVTGDKEIERKLSRLKLVAQRKVIRSAMRDGMKIVAAEVRATAPVLTGATKKAVKVRVPKKKKRNQIAMMVRIAGSEDLYRTTRAGKTYFIPAIVEYGRKGMRPNPFMLRAYTWSGDAAVEVTTQKIWRGIEVEARR